MATSYDLIVIGAGPGGYVAAIRAAQLGMKVACAEKRASLGGTCLNVGCIPSKALLTSSHKFEEAKSHLGAHGVVIKGVDFDLKAMMAHKNKVVADNTKGIEFLFKKNKIDWLKGEATITAPGQVKVGNDTYAAKNILIATGSESMPLKGVEVDEKQIVTSTGALELEKVPGHLVVIGGGVIGLELGSVWQRLGAKVTVIEFLDRILPGMDSEVVKQFHRLLEKQGMVFKLGSKVTGAKKDKSGVTLTVEPATRSSSEAVAQADKGGAAEEVKADVVLLAIGRRAYADKLGLDKVGVALDERGRVKVDGRFQSSVPGIYAIGDVIAGPMLAHKAEDEGVACAEILAGQHGHVNYEAIPGVVYTHPEVANVGATEDQLKEQGVAYKVGKFPFTANGRARAMNETDGLVKVLADATTDRLLGVHIVGPEAGTMIAEAVAVMEFGGSAEDLGRICHAHPTLNEAVKEAALAVDGRPIHI